MVDPSIIHPMMVHFPIALALVGFLFRLVSVIEKKYILLDKLATALLILAAIAALAASISGAFTPNLTGEANDVENIHHIFALLTTSFLGIGALIYLYSFIPNKSMSSLGYWIAFVAYGLGAICVGLTGYYGGYIVYNILL